MSESGPWLYPSPLCPALLEMTMIATVRRVKYIADIAHILHAPYAHGTAVLGTAVTAPRPF